MPELDFFPRPARQSEPALVPLRILATTDLHANILAWNYHANRPDDQVGLARVASLIRQARREQPQSLLFDNGDFLHGSALGDYLAETTPVLRSGRPLTTHPMIAAMNALRYDGATLGNHEFGFGLGFLRRSLAATTFPIVSSNLFFKPTRGKPLSLPFLLLDRVLKDTLGRAHSLRIAVMGFLPPQTMIWEQRYLKGRAMVSDIALAARDLLPTLRGQGADLVIALSHSGIGEANAPQGAENASSALAALDGIDAVIAGHTHLTFPTARQKQIAGKPVVMPGFHGSHLGVLDLRLRHSEGRWRVDSFASELRPIARRAAQTRQIEALVADDAEIWGLAQAAQAVLLRRAAVPVGKTGFALNSYFSLISDSAVLRLVTRAQAAHVARALAGRPEAKLPLLSAAAPFKAGGRGGPQNYTTIGRGILRARHISDLYLHPNSIAALRLSGAQVALWLERSVSLYHQIPHGAQDAELIDAAFPSFNFDVIDGVSYQIDLSQPPRFDSYGREINPAARRILDLRYQGRALAPDQAFILATNSYRVAGGIGFPGTTPNQLIYEAKLGNREILADYLRHGAEPDPQDAEPNWGFAPMPGTSVTFETAPEASESLAQVPHLRLQPLELLDSGFRRFRLQL
ncbi:MAG: bifunctional 2',3'-cyclic-nucleotide 2'-phosphodiesterase/3'-nucleotidase [Cypionkella sp.]